MHPLQILALCSLGLLLTLQGCCRAQTSSASHADPLGAACSQESPCQGSDVYCSYADLLCGGTGVCKAIPSVCTLEFRPVCGCDLETYSNPCLAATAGQAIFSSSACNASISCTTDSECARGSHCRFLSGQCSGVGLCSLEPAVCTLELNPVCGCNNQTYDNPCLAFSSGVSILSFGQCPAENAFACQNNTECSVGQYCRYSAGTCGGVGTCINVPQFCTLELNPVCGCNNQTYDNMCIASSAGVSLISLDSCEDIMPCTNSTECSFGQFCRFGSGTCGGVGSCSNIPGACTLELDPVCGCDNQTYDNPCVADASGVSVSFAGLCPVTEEASCTNSSQCAQDEYCGLPTGQCHGVGSCVTLPDVCPLLLSPVCGCDNTTYDNACIAAALGTSVLSIGGCDGTHVSTACSNNSDCAASLHCQFFEGQCSGLGVCVDSPQVCSMEVQPVCGCDGHTYTNRCAAQAQGVSVLSESACGASTPHPTSSM